MNPKILSLIKKELKKLKVEDSKLESLSIGNPMTELLMNPLNISAFFYGVGVPIINYGFDPSCVPIGRDFIFRKISEEGHNRILEVGRLVGDEPRALELAEAGQMSIAYLYTKLNVGDVANLCAYEQTKKKLGIAA